MCSISGFTWEDKGLIKKMNEILSYRGPDDTGIYTDNNISLGHNRLSILDLSKAGHQPMVNRNGNLFVIYNGEIYNFKEIRYNLKKKGYKFLSNTDTEVIINAYEEYGTKCLKIFNGMFAFAIWDSNKQELFIARDRIGIKPLYYYFDGTNIIFSSEIKAILLHKIQRKIDFHSLNSFLTYRFIPSNKTMIKSIYKLLPGHYLLFNKGKLKINRYWHLNWEESHKSFNFYYKKLNELLISSINKRLISDVPLGAYLSGGLDSSLIVAINARLREDAVKTFTVGFGHESDEFKYSQRVSDYLSTNHHQIILDYKILTKKLPKIIWHMDEPNSDITMVPLFFLSEFAKSKVTVVNTGEGADELFSGYYPYKVASRILSPIPRILKKNLYIWYYSPFKKNIRNKLVNHPVVKDTTLYQYLTTKSNINYPKTLLNKILYFDLKNELPNWQLARVDRMTMAFSMEARVPFLDHNLVEFSARLPIKYKQPNFSGKYILKKLALDYLPRDIVLRKKQGFTTPMDVWIKNNLGSLAESFLFSNKIPFLNYEVINKLIVKNKRSEKTKPFQYFAYQLLVLLFFGIWYDLFIRNEKLHKVEKAFN